jgi:hypothetical protein
MKKLVMKVGGMSLKEENRSIRRETCPSTNLSTTNPTLTHLGLNPGLCIERPRTESLHNDTAM